MRQGVPPGMKEHNFGFTLKTPDRSFLMGAESEKERREWMDSLQTVLVRPTTPQENSSRLLGVIPPINVNPIPPLPPRRSSFFRLSQK